MLRALLFILLSGLLWALLSWQQDAYTRLSTQRPSAQAQLELMRDYTLELKRLQATPQSPVPETTELITLLRSNAATQQLPLRINSQETRIDIEGEHIPVKPVLIWLAEMQGTYHLKTLSLHITGQDGEGKLRVVLEAQRSS